MVQVYEEGSANAITMRMGSGVLNLGHVQVEPLPLEKRLASEDFASPAIGQVQLEVM